VDVKIGVLAIQGDVSEHVTAFQKALSFIGFKDNANVSPIRSPTEIQECDALAIPGGESTTISRLIEKFGMRKSLLNFNGGIFATCAGMVLIASEVNDNRIQPLGIMDMGVERNAFGRQKESFEADIMFDGIGTPFHAIFIRAPVITHVGKGLRVLARIDQRIVAVQSEKHMAFSFHPELGGDLRLHQIFLKNLQL